MGLKINDYFIYHTMLYIRITSRKAQSKYDYCKIFQARSFEGERQKICQKRRNYILWWGDQET